MYIVHTLLTGSVGRERAKEKEREIAKQGGTVDITGNERHRYSELHPLPSVVHIYFFVDLNVNNVSSVWSDILQISSYVM